MLVDNSGTTSGLADTVDDHAAELGVYQLVCEDAAGGMTAATGTTTTVWFVDDDAVGAGDGTSWADAFTHPQTAEDAAASGEFVWVAEGTYRPLADDENFLLAVGQGRTVLGGFDGTETGLGSRARLFASTVLDADTQGDDSSGLYTDNANHVVDLADDARIEGFLLRSSYRDGGINAGSGVFVNNHRATMRDLHILNVMEPVGTIGVIMLDGDDLWVERVRVESDLGAISVYSDETATIVDSTIICPSNICVEQGGATGEATIIGTSMYRSASGNVLNLNGATSVLQNSVVFSPGGNALSNYNNVTYSAVGENITGTGVIYLDESTTELGDPFDLLPSGHLLLHPTSAALDAGDDSIADAWMPDWYTQTTLLTGAVDATPVDMGAHYDASGVIIDTLTETGGVLSWTSTGLGCWLTDGGTTYTGLPANGSQAVASGTWFLTCDDGQTDAVAMFTL
jgi:hypothetical protein